MPSFVPVYQRILRCSRCWLGLLLLCCGLHVAALAETAAGKMEKSGRWNYLAGTIFQHLGTERGLPHPIATAVHQSRDGFIWVGTQGGLARWDGYRFRNYLPNPKDPYSLPDVWIQDIHTDRAGRMWITTFEGGMAMYDARHDRFERIPIGPGGLSHATVWAVIDDGDGGLFIGTDGGLDQYMPDTRGMRHWQHNMTEAGGLPDNHVYALLREKNGDLWLGTGRGLVRRKAGSNQFESIPLPVVAGGAVQVRTLMQSGDGSIWVGTRRHGGFVRSSIRASGKEGAGEAPFLPLQQVLSGVVPSNKEWIHSFCEIAPRQIWIATDSGGIVHLDQKTMRTRRIEHDLRLPSSLSANSVQKIIRDRSGLIWVATRAGLNRHDPHQSAFLTLYGGSSKPDSISDPNLWSVFGAEDGRVWLGLGSQGVEVLSPENGVLFALRPDSRNQEKALPQEIVLSIAQAAPNLYLIGTALGLYGVDGQGRQLQRLVLPGTGGTPEVRAMLRQGDNLWIGTANDGLWQIDLSQLQSQEQGQPLLSQQNLVQKISTDWLPEQRINVIEAGPDNKLWLASRDSLILFDPLSRQVEKIKPNAAIAHALSSSAITSLLTDRQGRLWIATFGAGINILEKRDASGSPLFHRLSTGEGLPHANVNRLLMDKQGRIWASTDDGLAMINGKDYSVRKFQRADGVAISNYWARSGSITPQGELLFGGVGGLTVVRPEFLDEWTYRPQLVITDLRIGGKPAVGSQFNLEASATMGSKARPLLITPQANSIAVEFSALDFSAAEHNRYAYQLQGYESEWVESDAGRRLAAYTNLPPGKYTLRIRGSNRNGIWSEQDLQIPFEVQAAWHQTWWFYTLQGVAGLACVFLILQVRTRLLRQRQLQLQSQVEARTAEMLDSNQHLQKANEDLALSAETLRQLGEVGREITANLEAEAVFDALYRHVVGLLDTSVLVIYRASEDGTVLESGFGRQDGEVLPTFRVMLDSPSSNAARAAREQEEILLERKDTPGSALPISGRRMLTSLYGPLVVGQRLLGVMSIQSRREQAYGERERMIFRTLCAYGAIALANAQAISALHRAQAQLVQQEKLASLGGLVAGVAHEVNTPIGNAMLALSGNNAAWQKLDQGLANANLSKHALQQAIGEGLEYTGLALQNIKRTAALITSFQGIAVSFESDQYDEVELSRYLPDVVGVVHSDFEQFGHTLELDIEAGLHLKIVVAALTEVLSKILANVLDHAFASGRPGNVILTARAAPGNQVEIKIADNGQGIPAEALPKVFDPFYTSMSGSGGHVGLGLHVVYNHVTHRLHGQVSVASTLGQGTVVTLLLPVEPPR